MNWLGILEGLLKIFPFLEKWIDLKSQELPMKIKEHEEKEDLRVIENDIKEERKDFKLRKVKKRITRKSNKREL